MKQLPVIFVLIVLSKVGLGQQYGLYNTRTLFDSFENPAQRAFQIDSSRKYAFNFLIPTAGFNGTFLGPAQTPIKDLAFRGLINGALPIGEGGTNRLLVNSNTYLLMFKIYKNIFWNQELGFSWQVRQRTSVKASNETFVLLDNVRRFSTPEDFAATNILNNNGNNQVYHQFSFTYQDLTKRTGLGVKLSALSGILHNKFDVSESSIENQDNTYLVNLKGRYRSSFGFDTLDIQTALPLFKNPGVSVSGSASYKAPGGWYLLGTLKDLGLIKWSNSSYRYTFDGSIVARGTTSISERKELLKDVKDFVVRNNEQKGFVTPTDAKAEVLIEKDLGRYRPNVVLSKSLFYRDADLALNNHFLVRNWLFSVTGDYNFYNYFQLGGQGLYKTPNFELFFGSNQLFKTYYSTKNALFKTSANGKGYTGMSLYFGFAVKFGPSREHPLNSSSIPGIDNIRESHPGFFKKLSAKVKGKKKRY